MIASLFALVYRWSLGVGYCVGNVNLYCVGKEGAWYIVTTSTPVYKCYYVCVHSHGWHKESVERCSYILLTHCLLKCLAKVGRNCLLGAELSEELCMLRCSLHTFIFFLLNILSVTHAQTASSTFCSSYHFQRTWQAMPPLYVCTVMMSSR